MCVCVCVCVCVCLPDVVLVTGLLITGIITGTDDTTGTVLVGAPIRNSN